MICYPRAPETRSFICDGKSRSLVSWPAKPLTSQDEPLTTRKKGLVRPHNCKPLRSHYFQKWYVTRINSKAISIQYSVSKVFFETAHGSEIKMTSSGFRQVLLCTFQVMQDLFHQQYGQDALNPDWMESRWHHYFQHYLTTSSSGNSAKQFQLFSSVASWFLTRHVIMCSSTQPIWEVSICDFGCHGVLVTSCDFQFSWLRLLVYCSKHLHSRIHFVYLLVASEDVSLLVNEPFAPKNHIIIYHILIHIANLR